MFTKEFFQSQGFRRIVIMALLILLLYSIRSILSLILITFIFTFLMYRLQQLIVKSLNRFIAVNPALIVAVMYISLVTALVFVFYKYSPIVIHQLSQLIKLISNEFYKQPQDSEIVSFIVELTKQYDLTGYLDKGFNYIYKYITNVGRWGIQILLALVLSLFFLLEKQRIISFTSKFKKSKISAFYDEIEFFGSRFVRSFGKVIEVQFIIASINCFLTVIALWIMGFPQLIALGIMVFLLGLIPVAGVIISFIPLCTIAFTIGGLPKVAYLVITILIIHAIESYFLNPKLMSSKTDLPVFYTFIVLIVGEHFYGVWGLIVGIPMFIFLLDVMGVTKDDSIKTSG